MGPADTFSRVIKGRPAREQRDKETPEKRAPVKCDKGSLRKFENADTGERALALPRGCGIPKQRTTFLKNTSDEIRYNSDYEQEDDLSQEKQEQPTLNEEQREEMMEVSMDPLSQKMQG